MSLATPQRAGSPPRDPKAKGAKPDGGTRGRDRRRRGPGHYARRAVVNLLGALVVLVMGFPIYWMLNTAFKPANQSLTLTPKFLPTSPTLDNFRNAIDRPYFWDDVRNSLLIVGTTVVLAMVVSFLAAVAVARFEFRGRKAYIVMIIAVQMVPLNAMIIPIYLMLNKAGLTDRLPGVIVTYLIFVLPFTVWTLRGFIVNVPKELEEAAMVDGLSRTGAFIRILFPLVAPGLVATAIFAFIQAWNEYLLAYVLMSSPDRQTITVWLASFTTARGTLWGPLMAASTLTALPVVVFFLIVQRKVVAGMTAGAVKG